MFDPQWPHVKCFHCNKVLDPAFGEDTDLEPHDGLIFRAYGNYGSRVYDPTLASRGSLLIHICDECIVANKDLVLFITTTERVDQLVERWDPSKEY